MTEGSISDKGLCNLLTNLFHLICNNYDSVIAHGCYQLLTCTYVKCESNNTEDQLPHIISKINSGHFHGNGGATISMRYARCCIAFLLIHVDRNLTLE